MDTPWYAIPALLLLALLWRLLSKPRSAKLPFTRRPSLLTPGELRFYRTLRVAVPEGLTVFVKVRLMDVVAVDDWQKYGAQGSGMHLDFVLADAELVPCLVIELDDRSHAGPEAQRRDAFKDAVLASAGVPVLRVKVGRYDAGELRSRIRASCHP